MIPNRYTISSPDPDDANPWSEPHDWLCHWMERLHLTAEDLVAALHRAGQQGVSLPVVLKWRHRITPIPAEAIFPLACLFGFSEDNAREMACDAIKESYPALAEFIRRPHREQSARIRSKQLSLLAKQTSVNNLTAKEF